MEPLDVPLWPDRPRPRMRIIRPDAAGARPALVVFRGGGYARHDGSGDGSAAWAAQHGLVGVEVEYATQASGESHPRSVADAARAMRLVRARAAGWGIDPARVAVLGYSAGGHLATLLSTQPALWIDPADDLAAHTSPRPDLLVLAYPVVSFVDGYAPGAFGSSSENFFGHLADEATRRRFSSEHHVGADHPPTFLWTTDDDEIVPASHARSFADACRRAGVPVELIVYPHGRHGMGLAFHAPEPVRSWTTRLLGWLAARWPDQSGFDR
jgi:acetyl esterase/lipase